MIRQGLNTSIIGRAVENGLLSVNAVNIRDYTLDKHKKVDDYPYGGGAGMVMQAQPVYDAWRSVMEQIGYRPRWVYLTPQGRTFNQDMAKDFACADRGRTSSDGHGRCNLPYGSGGADQCRIRYRRIL